MPTTSNQEMLAHLKTCSTCSSSALVSGTLSVVEGAGTDKDMAEAPVRNKANFTQPVLKSTAINTAIHTLKACDRSDKMRSTH